MRFIDLDKFRIKYANEIKIFEMKEQEHVFELQNVNNKNEYIEKHSRFWNNVGDLLKQFYGYRCWYSDFYMPTDLDVDHFRPKGCAKNLDDTNILPEGEGYWWLAFDWTNYRIAGKWQNQKRNQSRTSGGKGDLFPISVGCTPASCKSELNDEDKLLIDPTVNEEAKLIGFNESGDVMCNSNNPIAEKMVDVSVKIYHLNNIPLTQERNRKWNVIWSQIKITNKLLEMGCEELFKENVENLKFQCKTKSSLSSVVISCLYSSGYGWAKQIADYELQE